MVWVFVSWIGGCGGRGCGFPRFPSKEGHLVPAAFVWFARCLLAPARVSRAASPKVLPLWAAQTRGVSAALTALTGNSRPTWGNSEGSNLGNSDGQHSPQAQGQGVRFDGPRSQLWSPPAQPCFCPFLLQAWIPNKYLALQSHLSNCFWRNQLATEMMLDFFVHLPFSVVFVLRRILRSLLMKQYQWTHFQLKDLLHLKAIEKVTKAKVDVFDIKLKNFCMWKTPWVKRKLLHKPESSNRQKFNNYL